MVWYSGASLLVFMVLVRVDRHASGDVRLPGRAGRPVGRAALLVAGFFYGAC